MKKVLTLRRLIINPIFFIAIFYLCMSNSGLQPTAFRGYTGAPGDSFCASCHSQSGVSIEGDISITGLPTTIVEGNTYPLTVTISKSTNASRAGFQLVALNGDEESTGTFTNPSTDGNLRTAGGRRYFGHAPAKSFGSDNSVSWTVDWVAPTGENGPFTFYGATIIADGMGGNSGDKFITKSFVTNKSGSYSALAISLTNTANPTCFSINDGKATAEVSGGSSTFTYLWSNGETTKTATSLRGGINSVTVTDAIANSSISSTIVLSSPSQISVINENISNPSCTSINNGMIAINASGGSGTLTYKWSNNSFGNNIDNLKSGTYTVSISDVNGCEITKQYTLNAPPSIEVQLSKKDINCAGNNNGAVNISATGGTPPYAYKWNDNIETMNRINLSSGDYTVTISDVNQCTIVLSTYIFEPAFLRFTKDVQKPKCDYSKDGSISILPNGGILPYSYIWSNGSTINSINNLSQGQYTVTVTDLNGCTLIENTILNGAPKVNIIVDEIKNPKCYNSLDGFIKLKQNDSLNYSWSNGTNTNFADNLSSGDYSIVALRSDGCRSETTKINLINPKEIKEINTTIEHPICYEDKGKIIANFDGGTGLLSYKWDNQVLTKLNTNPNYGQNILIVTDSLGCAVSKQYTITRPDKILAFVLDIQNVKCYKEINGNIKFDIKGNQGIVNINPSPTNLKAGLYDFTFVDSKGCKTTIDQVKITEPSPLLIKIDSIKNASQSTKNDGFLAITINGGTHPYRTVLLDEKNEKLYINQTAFTLPIGNYFVEVLDSNDCVLRSSKITISTSTAITDFAEEKIKLYPNPVNDRLIIDRNVSALRSFQIYDSLGNIIEEGELTDYQSFINSSDFPKGIYYLIVNQEGKKNIEKFIKL